MMNKQQRQMATTAFLGSHAGTDDSDNNNDPQGQTATMTMKNWAAIGSDNDNDLTVTQPDNNEGKDDNDKTLGSHRVRHNTETPMRPGQT